MKWFFLFILLLAGGLGWHQRDQLAGYLEPSPAKSLSTKTVSHPSGEGESILATGFVEGTKPSAALRFEIVGQLEKLLVEEGQRVEKGETLAEIDSSTQRQRVVQAEADLTRAVAEWIRLKNAARAETKHVAQAQVLVAEAEVVRLQDKAQRMKRLYDRGVATEEEWMDAFHPLQIAKARLAEKQALAAEIEAPARRDDLEVAQSKMEVAQAALAHAKLQWKKTKLTAPTAGTVLHIGSEPGELVGPTDSQPVLRFANLERMRVRAYVEEFHALKVSVGDPAEVTLEGAAKKSYKGTVVFCAPWMNEKQHRTHKPNELLDVRTREILIEVKQAAQIVVGLPVEVTIIPSQQDKDVLAEERSSPSYTNTNTENPSPGIPVRDSSFSRAPSVSPNRLRQFRIKPASQN